MLGDCDVIARCYACLFVWVSNEVVLVFLSEAVSFFFFGGILWCVQRRRICCCEVCEVVRIRGMFCEYAWDGF